MSVEDLPEAAEGTGTGQSVAAGTPIEGGSVEHLGALVPGGAGPLSESVRKLVLLRRTLDEGAGELVVAMMQSLEQQIDGLRADVGRRERRAMACQRECDKLGKENARLSASEKPWHERIRYVVGGGFVGLGFSGIAYGVKEWDKSGAAIALIGAVVAIFGVLLIALPILQDVYSTLRRKKG